MTNPLTQILNNAADLITATPTSWTQGTFARDQYGLEVDPSHEDAVCWCAIGAIARAQADYQLAYPSLFEDTRVGACRILQDQLQGALINQVNDLSTMTAEKMAAHMRAAALTVH
jgi:hypothetical protein